jgi:hypothetical protein
VGDNPQPLERDSKGILKAKSRFDDEVLTKVARQLYQDRLAAKALGVTAPGQAEYLDVLRVLDELVPQNKAKQLELLETIQEFALKKYPGMQKPQAPQSSDEESEMPEIRLEDN